MFESRNTVESADCAPVGAPQMNRDTPMQRNTITRNKRFIVRPMRFPRLARTGLCVLIMGGMLAACQPQPEAEAVPTATLAPLVTLTPRATATPEVTRTPLPTLTFTPSVTPIPPTLTNTFTPSPTPPVVGIISSLETVNIRSGPGADFGAFIALDPGTGVEVIGVSSDGRWLNVKLEDGRVGWAAAALVRVAPSPTPFPTTAGGASIDPAALASGTSLPTAVIGGAPVTPTPGAPAVTATPATAVVSPTPTNAAAGTPVLPVIDLNPINATSTALAALLGTPVPSAPPAQASATGLPLTPAPGASETAAPIPTNSGPISAPTTSGEPVVQDRVLVLAECDNAAARQPAPSNLADGSTIQLYWRWFARTEQQVRDHLDAAQYSLRINGQPVSRTRLNFTPISQRPGGDFYVDWLSVVGPLDAGTYRVEYTVSWSRQIYDGYDYFGPGTNNLQYVGTCTFVVR